MPLIDLPRALEEYFAFAETEPTRRGRRFSITLPFHDGERLERLQWWYHISPAHERMFEGHGIEIYRARAIERWLEITGQRLHGNDPIPRISLQRQVAMPASVEAVPVVPAEMVPWGEEKMAG